MNTDLLEIARCPKIFDIVIFDWVITLLVGYYMALLLHDKMKIKMDRGKFIVITIILLILLGIYTHIVFNVPTMLSYYLGISEKPLR
jgi:hypothetical protein